MKKRNKHIGSSLDDFLRKEGILDEARSTAVKESLSYEEKAKVANVETAANKSKLRRIRSGPQLRLVNQMPKS